MDSNYQYNKKLKGFARSLRKTGTKAEIRMWTRFLRANGFRGYSFLRQRSIGNHIADFFCKDLNPVIEVDGYSHTHDHRQDQRRDQYFQSIGLNVLRFTDKEVLNDPYNVERGLNAFIVNLQHLSGQ